MICTKNIHNSIAVKTIYAVKNFNTVLQNSSAMSQRKPHLIVIISSSLSIAVFDCRIYSLLFINVICEA